MQAEKLEERYLKDLWRPREGVSKFDSGQVVIIGGSSLFHGAPLLALKTASRCVGMVYLATPEADQGVAEKIKAGLSSFIWVPRQDLADYIKKSDAVLIGPGLMRNHKELDGVVCDQSGRETRELSLSVFKNVGNKKLVVDGGSLQVVDIGEIPRGAVITPNRKEYEMLFREKVSDDTDEIVDQVSRKARAYGMVILHKGRVSVVSDGTKTILVEGGSWGLAKGGVGDTMAGLLVGLLAKNEPVLAAAVTCFLVNLAAERLEKERGTMFNADDLTLEIALVFGELLV